MAMRKTPPWKEDWWADKKEWTEQRLRTVEIDPYKWSVLSEVVLSYWEKREPCVWHALVREDPKKYRATVWLRDQGFIIREGYRYYPTKWGYMLYTLRRRVVAEKVETPTLDQFFMLNPKEKEALSKRGVGKT